MGYYEGETLKKRIERGPLPIEEALDIAIQVAQGLSKAHAAGIIHRDIKPANAIITTDGLVKIVDFGIAKLLGVTGPTQTGTTLGTVSYMSPEQVAGEDADQQSDVWSLGAVLYEMLTGQQPFKGENQWAVMNAISNHTPDSPDALRAEIPAGVASVVMRALDKPKDKRYPSAVTFLADTKTSHIELTQPVLQAAATSSPWQALLTPKVAIPMVLVLLIIGAAGFWFTGSDGDARWAREEAIPEIMRLVESDDYGAAFALAEQAERYVPGDPTLVSLWPRVSATPSVTTTPPGAGVYVREYPATEADWTYLGQTPIDGARVPLGFLRWRLEREGYATAERAGYGSNQAIEVALEADGQLPPRMVRITPADSVTGRLWGLPLQLTGFDYQQPMHAPAYLIDQYEVTNREFREFVDAGGYKDPTYWQHEFVRDGEVWSWEDAMAEFRDITGRPGPSTWEGGNQLPPPEGAV